MDEIRIGKHVLQPSRQLLLDGAHIHLGPRALSILSALAEAKSEIVTKDELMQAVWGDVAVEENALQVHVTAVRKALGDDAKLLKTIRGIGYQLDLNSFETNSAGDTAPSGISPVEQRSSHGGDAPSAGSRVTIRRYAIALVAALIVAIAALGWFGLSGRGAEDNETQIAIYPLVATNQTADEVALAAGITDELIVRLRRTPGLRVISGNGQTSGGSNAIRGSVRTEGEQLRVSVRLEDPSGAILWSENFDHAMDDLLYVQESIAAAISGTLGVSLEVGVSSRSYGGTDNPEAYANYVRGRAQRHNPDRSVPTLFLERAVELDPDYALANTELSYAYGISLYYAQDAQEVADLQNKMDQASQRALDAQPELWVGHAARGWYHSMRGDLVRAQEFHEIVAELDPGNDPELRNTLANFHFIMGRLEASDELRRSKRLIDPIFRVDHERMITLLWLRRFEEAQAMGRELESSQPEAYQEVLLSLMWVYLLSGDEDAAHALRAKIVGYDARENPVDGQLDPNVFPDLPFSELRLWAQSEFGGGGRHFMAERAAWVAHFGKPELALDYLRIAFQDLPGIGGHGYLWHPALSETRKLPGFVQLIEDIGIVDVWRANGEWGDLCRPVGETRIVCD